ncbi:MAG: phosphatase PAP2 family protein [Clostridia bacterium]|nr:phosphatase PAP2 family protein [Clostridia bacterium]
MDWFFQLDRFLLDAVQAIRCSFLDFFMPAFSSTGNAGILWIAVALILLFPKKTRRIGITMGLAMTMGLLIGNGLIKNLVGRPRPYAVDPALVTEAQLLVAPLKDWSFPSGHTLAAFESAVSIRFYSKLWGRIALAVAVLFGISRLYLYVHWPSDVLAGALLGTGFAVAAYYIVRALEPKVLSLIASRKKA